MTASTSHWAFDLIGRPWAPAPADAPDTFYCWSLVRYALRLGYGLELPDLDLAASEDVGVAAIKHAAQGWHPVAGIPRDADIVLMDGPDGRHAGLMIETGRGLRMLHANGHMQDGRPVGSVVCESIKDATGHRYLAVDLWRRA